MAKYLIDIEWTAGDPLERQGYLVEAISAEAAVDHVRDNLSKTNPFSVVSLLAPAFVDLPRYRRSGARVPIAYIAAASNALGIKAGQTVAEIYLNDEHTKGETAARKYIATSFLATLNEAARVEAL